MKRMNKVLVLLSMLLVGSSFMSTNNENNAVVAEAAGGSNVMSKDWKTIIKELSSVNTLFITNKSEHMYPDNMLFAGSSYDVDTDTSSKGIDATIYYVNAGNGQTELECVIYLKYGSQLVPEYGTSLFAGLENIGKIVFDCPIYFSGSRDRCMQYLFDGCKNLTTIEGIDNLKTTNVTVMSQMFRDCKSLKTITGLNKLVTINIHSMDEMFKNCTALETLDLSGFDFSNIWDVTDMISTATNLQEIKAPGNMNGVPITLPAGFYIDKIDPSMQGTTILRGSKEFNELVNTLRSLSTCLDYMQGPRLKVIYDNLVDSEKEIFATLKDGDGVLLLDKLLYMAHFAEVNPKEESATAGKNLVATDIASQSPVLVVLIGCLSLAFIGGYYLAQKRKYAK